MRWRRYRTGAVCRTHSVEALITPDAAALATAGKTLESVEYYEKSIDLNPQQVGALVGLGHVLKTLGNYDEGIEAYQRARDLKPNFGEIYFSLSNLKTYRFSDADIDDMLRRVDQEGLSLV